jgi:hypothetical protein
LVIGTKKTLGNVHYSVANGGTTDVAFRDGRLLLPDCRRTRNMSWLSWQSWANSQMLKINAVPHPLGHGFVLAVRGTCSINRAETTHPQIMGPNQLKRCLAD